MIRTSQPKDVKSRFSEAISNAEKGKIQIVSKKDKNCMVVIPPIGQHKKLIKKKESLREFFNKAPMSNLDIERNKDMEREIEL